MKITPKRAWALASVIAMASVVTLTGCNGGAQNIDPAAQNPGASAKARTVQPCTVVADAALQTLAKSSTKGTVAVAYARKTSKGWYVAGPVGDNTSYSSIIGLWATKGDITSEDFGSTFYSLNKDAQTSTKFIASAPSGFSATSSEAKKALSCAKSAKTS